MDYVLVLISRTMFADYWWGLLSFYSIQRIIATLGKSASSHCNGNKSRRKTNVTKVMAQQISWANGLNVEIESNISWKIKCPLILVSLSYLVENSVLFFKVLTFKEGKILQKSTHSVKWNAAHCKGRRSSFISAKLSHPTTFFWSAPFHSQWGVCQAEEDGSFRPH